MLSILLGLGLAALFMLYLFGVAANIEGRRALGQSWIKAITWAIVWPYTYRLE